MEERSVACPFMEERSVAVDQESLSVWEAAWVEGKRLTCEETISLLFNSKLQSKDKEQRLLIGKLK